MKRKKADEKNRIVFQMDILDCRFLFFIDRDVFYCSYDLCIFLGADVAKAKEP
jgi:hypothetical protein